MARSVSEKKLNERNEQIVFEKLFVIVAAVAVVGCFRGDTNWIPSLCTLLCQFADTSQLPLECLSSQIHFTVTMNLTWEIMHQTIK